MRYTKCRILCRKMFPTVCLTEALGVYNNYAMGAVFRPFEYKIVVNYIFYSPSKFMAQSLSTCVL